MTLLWATLRREGVGAVEMSAGATQWAPAGPPLQPATRGLLLPSGRAPDHSPAAGRNIGPVSHRATSATRRYVGEGESGFIAAGWIAQGDGVSSDGGSVVEARELAWEAVTLHPEARIANCSRVATRSRKRKRKHAPTMRRGNRRFNAEEDSERSHRRTQHAGNAHYGSGLQAKQESATAVCGPQSAHWLHFDHGRGSQVRA
jgi:hypothetical protein